MKNEAKYKLGDLVRSGEPGICLDTIVGYITGVKMCYQTVTWECGKKENVQTYAYLLSNNKMDWYYESVLAAV